MTQPNASRVAEDVDHARPYARAVVQDGHAPVPPRYASDSILVALVEDGRGVLRGHPFAVELDHVRDPRARDVGALDDADPNGRALPGQAALVVAGVAQEALAQAAFVLRHAGRQRDPQLRGLPEREHGSPDHTRIRECVDQVRVDTPDPGVAGEDRVGEQANGLGGGCREPAQDERGAVPAQPVRERSPVLACSTRPDECERCAGRFLEVLDECARARIAARRALVCFPEFRRNREDR